MRYSIENPLAYVDSNVVGMANVLEGCRHNGVEHLVYASTSSVYGANTKMPFSVHQNVDHPLSFYAATKKANELMAHTYAHLYRLPMTGLRFFTVYGPWGRPDMALFLFTRNILAGKPIDVFNYGHHRRDFTYVDDIAEGVVRACDRVADRQSRVGRRRARPGARAGRRTGSTTSATTSRWSCCATSSCSRTASAARREMNLLPLQAGDVPDTWADIEDLHARRRLHAGDAGRESASRASSTGTSTTTRTAARRPEGRQPRRRPCSASGDPPADGGCR